MKVYILWGIVPTDIGNAECLVGVYSNKALAEEHRRVMKEVDIRCGGLMLKLEAELDARFKEAGIEEPVFVTPEKTAIEEAAKRKVGMTSEDYTHALLGPWAGRVQEFPVEGSMVDDLLLAVGGLAFLAPEELACYQVNYEGMKPLIAKRMEQLVPKET